MNALTKLVLILCTILPMSTAQAYGEKIISSQVGQNCEMYDINTHFTSPSELTIYLSNEFTRGKWSVEFLTKDDTYQSISCWRAYTGTCTISPAEYVGWNYAKRIYDETLNQDLFQFRVSFTTTDGIKDEIYLLWGLLPTRPIISNVLFTYIYDWEYDDIYPNGNLSLDVYSKYAQKFEFNTSASGLFERPDWFGYVIYYNADELLKVKDYKADWGEYIDIAAGNHFGYVHSDVICTTSYITDEEILKRIEELREQAGVEDVSIDVAAPSYRWNNSILTFSVPIENISVYNLKGILQCSIKDSDMLDLSHLPKGLYIITYQYKSQIFRTKISKS